MEDTPARDEGFKRLITTISTPWRPKAEGNAGADAGDRVAGVPVARGERLTLLAVLCTHETRCHGRWRALLLEEVAELGASGAE